MFVKSRKEPESVLARELVLNGRHAPVGQHVSALAFALVAHRNAAGLAAGNVAALEDHNLEAALNELVRGTHATHAAAQDNDPSRHVLS